MDRWKMTRSSSPSMVSSHAVWFRKLFRTWFKKDVKQALYFTQLSLPCLAERFDWEKQYLGASPISWCLWCVYGEV
jgi:hypothetical protein